MPLNYIRPRLVIASSFVFLFGSLFPSTARAWELNSENTRTGIVASAVQFWVQGIGPVTPSQFFNGEFEDNTYWASFILMCEKKKLTAYFNLEQTGSGHDEIKLDDPGYATLVFNGTTSKRYRTFGLGIPSSIAIQKDAVALAKGMLSKQTLSTTLKLRFSNRIPVKFNISGLSKAKTRFKYAGCSF